jgi:sensor histidine kinase YesM
VTADPASNASLPASAAGRSLAEDLSAGPRPFLVRLAIELGLGGWIGALVGALVGGAASVVEQRGVSGPLIAIGAVTGLVVGVVAVLTGREILPRLSAFPLPVRGLLMVLSLVGGAFAATLIGFWLYPRFALYSFRGVLLVGSTNGLLALVAGAVVFLYEDLARRLARTRAQLLAERVAQAQARERAARAELQALQARINPHFFFNALNTVAAFVTEDPPRAERLLERFAGLFRYAFRKGSEETVPLEQELAFVRDLLEIEQARFGERVRVVVEVDDEVAQEPVPPLILQPLVENAVLHGRDPESGDCRIVVRAGRDEDGRTVICVLDGGPGPGRAIVELPRGHALENIAARVVASRGGSFEILERADVRGTEALIVLPPIEARETGE